MNLLPEQAREKIAALSAELEKHNRLYYIDAQPQISDAEFDQMMKELEALEAKFPEYRLPESPTQRVGGEITKEFPTFTHKKPMKSLENAYSFDELREFHERIEKGLMHSNFDYIAQLKIDGVALSLHYENGVLTHGVTRGNGTTGDLITPNVRTIRSIPLRVAGSDVPKSFEVRGEVFMTRKDFDEINAEKAANGEPLLANPRNATAGTLKLQDSGQVAKRRLSFIAYFLDIEGKSPATDWECMQLLKNWGFPVSSENEECANLQDLQNYILKWDTQRNNLPYDTDGVVIKLNQLELREELGFRSKSPRWALAYKYAAEQAETTLLSVDYQVGRTGYITPVANLEPVQLAGTTVKRASLYNFDEINRLGLHFNDRVVIEKSGEIIPKVMKTLAEKRAANAEKIEPVSNCPACQTPLVQNEGEVGYYCPNEESCTPQVKGKIEHFASKKAMDIDGLGTEVVAQLVDAGLIKDYTDLYDLTVEKLLKLDRFAQKSAQNLINGIEKTKQAPFHRVLYAIGIRYVGETIAMKLAVHFQNLDKLKSANFDTIRNVYEIGDKIAESVVKFFSKTENISQIEKLRNAGLQFEMEERKMLSEKLSGKKFLASGTFDGYDRDDIKNLITSNGGAYVSSISKNLDYLVVGEKMGAAKKEKAEQLGIKMIPLEELLLMIEGEIS